MRNYLITVVVALAMVAGTAMAGTRDGHPVIHVGIDEAAARGIILSEPNETLTSVDAYHAWSDDWFPNNNGHWILGAAAQWTCREKVDDLPARLAGAIDQLGYAPEHAVTALKAIVHDFACEDIRNPITRQGLAKALVHLGVGHVMVAGEGTDEATDAFRGAVFLEPDIECPEAFCAYDKNGPENRHFAFIRDAALDPGEQSRSGGTVYASNLEEPRLNDGDSWQATWGLNTLHWVENNHPEQHLFLSPRNTSPDLYVVTRADWREQLTGFPETSDKGEQIRAAFAKMHFPHAEEITFVVADDKGGILLWTYLAGRGLTERRMVIADTRGGTVTTDPTPVVKQKRPPPERTISQLVFGPALRLTGTPSSGYGASSYVGPTVGGRIALVGGLQLSVAGNVLLAFDADEEVVLLPYATIGAGYRLPGKPLGKSELTAWIGGEALVGAGGEVGKSMGPSLGGHFIGEVQIAWIAIQGRIGGGSGGLDGGVNLLLQIPFAGKKQQAIAANEEE